MAGRPRSTAPKRTEVIKILVTPELDALVTAAAAREGRSVSDWGSRLFEREVNEQTAASRSVQWMRAEQRSDRSLPDVTRPTHPARMAPGVTVTPDTLTREMAADLMTIADVRVATDCQAFIAGRGGRAKLGLIRERVASAYNRQFTAHVAPGKRRSGR